MNSSNGSSSRTSSTPASSSTLRPRAPRLISGLDEGDEVTFNPARAPNIRIASPLPSPYESREPSPIPSQHLPRTASSRGARHLQPNSLNKTDRHAPRSRPGSGRDSPASLSGFFSDSWTALQGAATDFLSGSTSPTNGQPKKRNVWSKTTQPRTASVPPQWGPPGGSPNTTSKQVGGGSSKERDALVRAQKRKELLAAGVHEYADSLGRIKRRTSEDMSASAPPGDNEHRDALVYIHHVRPSDTLAGITIKYSISAAALRKANRMWPNDQIQVRKVIMLPVDACAVKGRPISTEECDLITGTPDISQRDDPFPTSATPELQPPAYATHSRHPSISTASDHHTSVKSNNDAESQYAHDSWVLLPNSTKPTQIGRLSRMTLGFFPPARRKSQSYSDFDTPSTSLDIGRSSLDFPAVSPQRRNSQQRPQRPRRLSNATNAYFPSYLAGPGGVGTMNKNVKSPGPAQDGLNKIFASHLPNVAPPPNQQSLYLPDIPLYSDTPGTTTPVTSGTQSPGGMNIENMGGAIEGWVRKIAAKASTTQPLERRAPARASVGVPGKGVGSIGDLIEMADQFEIGGDEDEEEERGRQGSATAAAAVATSSTSYGHDALRARGRSGHSVGAQKRAKDD